MIDEVDQAPGRGVCESARAPRANSVGEGDGLNANESVALSERAAAKIVEPEKCSRSSAVFTTCTGMRNI